MPTSRALLGSLAAVGFGVATTSALDTEDALVRVALSVDGVQGDWNTVEFTCTPDVATFDLAWFVVTSYARNLINTGDHNEWANAGADIFAIEPMLGGVERVSVSTANEESNDCSYSPSVSAEGRFIAFQSYATNLVAGDANGEADIFLRDRDTNGDRQFSLDDMSTIRVNVATGGGEANGHSYGPVVTADGRAVFFSSHADNLVAGDTNGVSDVFRYDVTTGTTARVSLTAAGAEADGSCTAARPSADGTKLLFLSDATNLVAGDTNDQMDVFLRDLVTGAVERISVATGGSEGDGPSTSHGGMTIDDRFVLFGSYATNLVAGDGNGQPDVFLRDRVAGITTRVSLASDGSEANERSWPGAIAADGSRIAFSSFATNLDPRDTDDFGNVYWRDVASGTTEPVFSSRSGALPDESCFFACANADLTAIGCTTLAANLVSWDTNAAPDLRDGEEPYLRRLTRAIGTASWRTFGDGLPGLVRAYLTPTADPVLGSTLTLMMDNSARYPTVGFLVAGVEVTAIPMRGGLLAADGQLAVLPVALGIGSNPFDVDVGDDPLLVGVSVIAQLAQLDVMTPRGMSLTQGIELVLGR